MKNIVDLKQREVRRREKENGGRKFIKRSNLAIEKFDKKQFLKRPSPGVIQT